MDIDKLRGLAGEIKVMTEAERKSMTWQDRLAAYTDESNREHYHECASYAEGQECCLNKLWLKSFISSEIDKAREEGMLEGTESWRHDYFIGEPAADRIRNDERERIIEIASNMKREDDTPAISEYALGVLKSKLQ